MWKYALIILICLPPAFAAENICPEPGAVQVPTAELQHDELQCSEEATRQNLKGDERLHFRVTCLHFRMWEPCPDVGGWYRPEHWTP